MNIFEELDKILNSVNESEEVETAKEKAEKIVKSIPVNPEMETEEQGRKKALEKLAKYFYKLEMGSDPDAKLARNDDIDLPDDWLDPKMKGRMSGKIEDKEFQANKVVWDSEEEMDKLEKEIDVNMHGSDDDFDDFDYRDNSFGDDIDQDELDTDDLENDGGGSGDDSEKSEDEKLRDTIDDAIDKMSDDGIDDDKEGGQQGGQQGGQEGQEGGQQGGQEGQEGGQQGGQEGQEGGQQGGQEGGQGGKQSGKQSGNQDDHGNPSGGAMSGSRQTSAKDNKLKKLKDALDNNDKEEVKNTIDELKEGEPDTGKLAGARIGEVSDKDLRGDMSKAGVSKEDIDEMSKAVNDNPTEQMDDGEMEKLKKDVVDGLEKKCAGKGGSALARTVVKNALKSKINNDEWKTMLKLFLDAKSINAGDMSKSRSGTKYGHKNHLWRDAVLPTKTQGRGQIQTIYCFIDFSGSVEKDLVYIFLGRVIDLCTELNYTNIVVYGFGSKLVLPRKINGKMLKKDGKDVVLAQTWDFIDSQKPGEATENFMDVANEILQIRRKERDAVYLIFGDGFWQDPRVGPMCLRSICGERVLNRICALTYYDPDYYFEIYKGCIAMLKELVGLKNVITTKVSRIMSD